MTKCKGCGIKIQYTSPNLPGFSSKEGSDLCQRCFRLTHYGDLTFSSKEEIHSIDILTQIAKMDALVLWIVDLFDFETAMQESINRWLKDHDILMVCTKRDLLPQSVGPDKLGKFILARLKQSDIAVKGLIVIGQYGLDGKDDVLKAVEQYRNERDVVVIGSTNAGKSTLLKNVFGIDSLTVSRYPGTTLDFIPIALKDFTIYDTPGFNRTNNAQILLDDADMKKVIPTKAIKPRGYQLQKDQTLSLGGLLRVDLLGCANVSCVCYFADGLNIHRSKTANADQLWKDHFGTLLTPTIGKTYSTKKRHLQPLGEKFDVVVLGLGWICITGRLEKIMISGCEEIDVRTRKAMI